jgi:hypothetical protein
MLDIFRQASYDTKVYPSGRAQRSETGNWASAQDSITKLFIDQRISSLSQTGMIQERKKQTLEKFIEPVGKIVA